MNSDQERCRKNSRDTITKKSKYRHEETGEY
jgi:hypothetical protein